MKIFISIPMFGKDYDNLVEDFKFYTDKLKEEYGEDTEILPSLFQEENTPIGHLSEALKLLDKADIVYFASGWEQNRGCNVERHVAEVYGKAIQTEV